MDHAAAERLRLALELYELGERMLRQRLRRERPHASDAEIDDHVRLWLHRRPGAEHGDAVGRPAGRPVPMPASSRD